MFTLKQVLTETRHNLCRDVNQGAFIPPSKADIAAYLYHRLPFANLLGRDIHLNARILNKDHHYDFVNLDLESHQMAVSNPAPVIQIALFPRAAALKHDLPAPGRPGTVYPACRRSALPADFNADKSPGYLQAGLDARARPESPTCVKPSRTASMSHGSIPKR